MLVVWLRFDLLIERVQVTLRPAGEGSFRHRPAGVVVLLFRMYSMYVPAPASNCALLLEVQGGKTWTYCCNRFPGIFCCSVHMRVCLLFRAHACMSDVLHNAVSGTVPRNSPRSPFAVPCTNLQIDVMVLLSPELIASMGEAQVASNVVAGFSTSNQATANSDIDLVFNLVHVGEVRATSLV